MSDIYQLISAHKIGTLNKMSCYHCFSSASLISDLADSDIILASVEVLSDLVKPLKCLLCNAGYVKVKTDNHKRKSMAVYTIKYCPICQVSQGYLSRAEASGSEENAYSVNKR